jgi:hypothetical protein
VSRAPDPGLSARAAFRIEVAIIGLGVLALVMIFQPFALAIFTVGCVLVVIAALANNLLPVAQPGKPARGVAFAAAIVALVFCLTLLVSIAAAHLYGVAFLNPPPAGASPVPPAAPFWRQPLYWGLAAAAVVFSALVRATAKRR